jgi:outer membrane protein assembly factor BamB
LLDVDGPVASAVVATVDAIIMADNAGIMRALDPASGDVIWQTEVGGPLYAALSYADGVIYADTESGGDVVALDAATGAVLWRYQTGYEGDWRASSPVLVDGVLYVGSNDEHIYALTAP